MTTMTEQLLDRAAQKAADTILLVYASSKGALKSEIVRAIKVEFATIQQVASPEAIGYLTHDSVKALAEMGRKQRSHRSTMVCNLPRHACCVPIYTAAPAQAATVVEYVPIAINSNDEAGGRHPNDNTPTDAECRKALNARGDDSGQGLCTYWKWGFRAGWHDHKRIAAAGANLAQAATEAARENLALVIARLEQIKHIAEETDVRAFAKEALVCANAIARRITSTAAQAATGEAKP